MTKGRFTGHGDKYEPAGIVHKGEYVIPKEGVDQKTGKPKESYLEFINDPSVSEKEKTKGDVDLAYKEWLHLRNTKDPDDEDFETQVTRGEWLDDQQDEETKAYERKRKLEWLKRLNEKRSGYAYGGTVEKHNSKEYIDKQFKESEKRNREDLKYRQGLSPSNYYYRHNLPINYPKDENLLNDYMDAYQNKIKMQRESYNANN